MAAVRALLVSAAVVLALIFCVVSFVLLLADSVGNDNDRNALSQCALNGSCVGGNVTASTVVVDTSIVAANIQWTDPPVQRVNGVTPDAGAGGEIHLQTWPGSNILIGPGVDIRLTQAIVVASLDVEHTVFGSSTSCVRPLSTGCLDISSQSCTAQMPLIGSCMPNNATFDTLHVRHAIIVVLGNETELPANATLNTTHLFVTDNATVTGVITCQSGVLVDNGCVALGEYNCSTPLDANCIPTSIPFYDVTVTHTLNTNETQCLGPPLDASCYSTLALGGDVNGTWLNAQVQALQGTALDLSTGLAAPSALSMESGWRPKLIDALGAQPDSLMLRDANQNSSAATTYSEAASIQSAALNQCVGIGTPPAEAERHVFYFLTTSEHGATTAYFGSPDTLWSYNALTDITTYIGLVTGLVAADSELEYYSLAMHPNGTLYTHGYPSSQMYQVDKTTAVLTPVCYGVILSSLTWAIDAYGTVFQYHSNGQLLAIDLTTCTSTLVKTVSPLTTGAAAIIGSTMYVTGDNGVGYYFDIRASTPTTVYSFNGAPGYTLNAHAVAGGLYTQCINEAQLLGGFIVSAAVGNTTAIDPLSGNIVPGQFKWTNNGAPGTVFGQCSPVMTAAKKCYYPWGQITSNCFTPYQDVAGTCLQHGDLNLEHHDIRKVDGLFVSELYASTEPEITVQTNVSIHMLANALVFGDTNTTLATSTAATTTLVIDTTSGGGANLLQINNYVQASRFQSPLGSITLTAGAGAGTTTPATLTATNGRGCRWQVSVTTTAAPAANSVIFHVALAGQTEFAPGVVFSPVVQAAVQLAANQMPYVANENVTGFDFMSGSTGLAASTNYRWNFQNCI